VDAVTYSYKKYLRVISINAWLKLHGYPPKNLFKSDDIKALEYEVGKLDIEVAPNWYSKFGWAEDDSQSYYWPVKK
jgi:hypothetical protein